MPGLGKTAPLSVTKELLLEIGGWRTLKEGQALFEGGKVDQVHYDPPLLHGVVKTGTSTVNARLHVGSRLAEVENLCSCRQAREYGTVCAHVIALGLKLIQQQNSLLAPLEASVEAEAEAVAPASRLVFIPRSEAADSTPFVELQVILPLDFEKAWDKGGMQVGLEALVNGEPCGLLDKLERQAQARGEDRVVYSLSDADIPLVDFMQREGHGALPGTWLLDGNRFSRFFECLLGHPRVTLGKKQAFKVARSPERSKIHFSLTQAGELLIRQQDPAAFTGKTLFAKHGQWKLAQDGIYKINGLPPAYQELGQRDLVIPRNRLGHFFQHEISFLERQADSEMDESCSKLEFVKLQPQVKIQLDGMLAGLSCRVVAEYEGEQFCLMGVPDKTSTAAEGWSPDPAHALRYFVRDREAEQRIKMEVIMAGFTPGQRQPEFYTLSSEKRVGHFLANVMPKWQMKWDVMMTKRMSQLMKSCDVVEPEFAVRDTGEDWLAMDVLYRSRSGEEHLSSAEVERFLNTGASHQRLANGRILLLPTQGVREVQEVFRDCQIRQDGKSGMKFDRRYAQYLYDALGHQGFDISSPPGWQPPERVKEYEALDLPDSLQQRLRGYQITGVNWLNYLYENRFCGILADEMGLGKTVQTLAYLQIRRERSGTRTPCLIVCPTSLVNNWESEARIFTPHFKTLVIAGAKRQQLFEQIDQVDIVITSYALLRRDVGVYETRQFDVAVLDEAQHIKNRQSQNAQCAKSLKADYRLVLTGTPIENSLLDLWSIFDFLMPGYLGPASDFKERYQVPISKMGDATAQNRLKQRVQPFILRRLKRDVAKELPAKMEQMMLCELSDEQKLVYQAILEQARRNVFEQSGKNGKDRRRMEVLTALTRLRQICCHLGMLPGSDEKTWKEPSAKMEFFFELLDQCLDGGHRVLVFSQYVSLLKLVSEELKKRELEFCYLDGSTADRRGVVERFQQTSSIPLFLISLKAGGTGLNLTGADTVIHFDPWWNPAVEDQATARAHRIGQTRIVSSYKLIARGTVEEKIVQLQQKKKDLVQNTLVSEEAFVQSLSWEELQALLE